MATLRWLTEFDGVVTRRQYLGWGGSLLALKALLEAWLGAFVLGVAWSPFLCLTPVPWSLLSDDSEWRWLLFVVAAVSFCWIGLSLTARRLADAGVTPGLAIVILVPYANLLLFSVLSVCPSRRAASGRGDEGEEGWAAQGPWPAVLAALLTMGLALLSFDHLHHYGGLLFLCVPMCQGFLAGMLTGAKRSPMAQFFASAGITVLLLIALAWEGVACVVMATPLWALFGVVGVLLGQAVRSHGLRHVAPALLVLPVGQLAEPGLEPPPQVHEVTTEVVVRARPEQVWRNLLEFGEIDPPTELPFRAGIAYPVRATIEGRGVGAVRRCSFNTGDFVEPIEVWDEPRLLRFSVAQSPQPMIEWNPFHEHVHAAHLHGFFVAQRGQFELLPRADGSTLLRGTTWYSHGLRPEAYWRLWSDWLVHTIHLRVLHHIRARAER